MDIYLTEHSKAEYMRDFESVLNFKNESWKLDELVIQPLQTINSNLNVQTQYSKWGPGLSRNTYLEICYVQRVEKKIFRQIIPKLLCVLNDLQGPTYQEPHKFFYLYSVAKDNPNYRSREELFGLMCIDSPDYFRINHIHFELENGNDDANEAFWKVLVEDLTKLH